ncbi:MAG: protein translocase subunit SecF [Candidatus Dependentiae bacterium]|nr:protein translocase subunit SecF [Candidatus Dependentiae bacterium]
MIDFLKYRVACAVYSVVLIATFAGTYIYKAHTRGGQAFTYSIDFTGGTQVRLKFDKPVSSNNLKEIVEKSGWQGAVIRDFSSQEVLVRVKEFSNDSKGLGQRIVQAIQAGMPDNNVELQESESVGAGVGATLRYKSMRAVIIGLIAMLLYIAIRFWSFAFAAGAVVALAHDAIVIVAVFLFLDKEISINLIGAILAVLGYSINDTIVIFARIRENFKKMPGKSTYEVVNTSINQTLRRTLLTSFATALTAGSMCLLGGEVLRDFSLALLIGIVFGTYSSIYIASPVMMLLYKEPKK